MPEFRRARGPWVPLVGIMLIACVGLAIASDRFLTSANGYVILSSAALLCVIGFSQLVVLSVGEFSLAVGGIGTLIGVVLGWLLVEQGVPLAPAALLALVAGAACGFVNGLLVAKSGVNGFIITLATGGAFTGIALGITKTTPYTGLPVALTTFGTGRVGPLPYLLIATVVVALALAALFRWLRVGRLMLAVGGNPEAAALSGLSPARAVIWAHTLSGLLAGIAGVMAAAQLHEANPSVGVDWLISSFTVAIVGGTVLSGGSVSVLGLFVAGLILATINDALVLLNVNPYWVTLAEGLLVFVAVVLGRGSILATIRGVLGGAGGRKAVRA
jgi:ribose transport system permease protein